jgi:alpha-galactosidase/6-phospho-beta-glucosidase family protein
VTRDIRTARLALLAHPLIAQWDVADELLERLLAAPAPVEVIG